jgi:hypothetical protein
MSSAFTGQASKEHLVRGGGLAHEISKLRQDTSDAFNAAEAMSVRVARWEGPSTGLIDANGIVTAGASALTPQTWTAAQFDGALCPTGLGAIINSPKKITFQVTGAGTPAHWVGGAASVTLTGTDSAGLPLVEELAPAAGAATTTSVNYFATLSQVELIAGGGTGATIVIGVAADLASICNLASSASDQIIDGTVAASWNRDRIGNRALAYPHRLSFVFDAGTAWSGQTVTVRGRDALGVQITSTFLATASQTRITDKFFSSIERITLPGSAGTAGTCTVCPYELSIGLSLDPLNAVFASTVLKELSRASSLGSWADPTDGAIADAVASNAGPYGSYTPHTSVPFDGVREFLVAYIPK